MADRRPIPSLHRDKKVLKAAHLGDLPPLDLPALDPELDMDGLSDVESIAANSVVAESPPSSPLGISSPPQIMDADLEEEPRHSYWPGFAWEDYAYNPRTQTHARKPKKKPKPVKPKVSRAVKVPMQTKTPTIGEILQWKVPIHRFGKSAFRPANSQGAGEGGSRKPKPNLKHGSFSSFAKKKKTTPITKQRRIAAHNFIWTFGLFAPRLVKGSRAASLSDATVRNIEKVKRLPGRTAKQQELQKKYLDEIMFLEKNLK